MSDIDFVLTWVDGSDKAWLEQKAKYADECAVAVPAVDNRTERYRNWDVLRYWFRGVEECAPWVHKIFFVTWGHVPEWLDVDSQKLEIVNHRDYIPEEFLPTFNSHAIELNLHRIKGLSEQFVYFNDDFFIINDVKPTDFFVEGLPKDMLAFQPVVANRENPTMSYIFFNNIMVLSKYFDKRDNVKKNPKNYFHVGYPPLYFFYNMLELAFPRYTGLYTVHGPSPFLKEAFREVWEKEEAYLNQVCGHKFRNTGDVNQYLIREWQKLSNMFKPANVKKGFRYFEPSDDNEKLYETVKKRACKTICINDADRAVDFEGVKRELIKCFEHAFPRKSSFEKNG